MNERSEQDARAADAGHAGRKHIAEGAVRVLHLLASLFWLLVFVMFVRTGYLSWIGLTVGAVFVGSVTISPILGWGGRKRLELALLGVYLGLIGLVVISGVLTLLWPQDDGAWRPYRFDDELAAIEARRSVPDAENAAHRYESVFRQTDEQDEPNCLFIAASSLRSEFQKQPWKSDDYPEASSWLDSRFQVLDALLEIGRMEKCRWPVQADRYDKYTVPYKNLRHCMLLLIAAGNRDVGAGRVADALTKCLCTLRIGDHIRQQPSQVDCFTGFGCEGNGLQIIRDLLVGYNLSDEDIARIAIHLPPAPDPWPQEWERLMEHEKLHYMNLLGRLYEQDDRGRVRFAAAPAFSSKEEQRQKDAKSAGRFPWVYWLMSMPRDPHGVRDIADRYFAKVDGMVSSERAARRDTYGRHARASRSDFAKAMCNSYRWCVETFFFDGHEYVKHRQRRTPYIAARRGTWLVLGLRRYHNAHGVWPHTLDAISEYVPAEAFVDPAAGGAFVYRLDGDSFRLYSKGLNRVDEGGRHGYVRALKKSEDDIPIWPRPAPEPESEPSEEENEEEMRMLEEMYGKEYVETLRKDKGSDKR